MPALNRLERVRDLRSIWPTEAADFTPWLASESNIDLLSDALGVDLEVVQAEAAVGPYRADIHCRDVLSGDSVLVENHLRRRTTRTSGSCSPTPPASTR